MVSVGGDEGRGRADAEVARGRLIAAAWIVGFVCCLSVLYWWGYWGPSEIQRNKEAPKPGCEYPQPPNEHAKHVAKGPLVIVCFNESASQDTSHTNRENEESLRDVEPLSRLVARRIVSDPVALFTIVLALFTWRLIVVGRYQHRAAMDALDLANKEFVSTHRPKLIVRDVMAPWADGQDGTGIDVLFSVVNIGDTEAIIETSHAYCEWFDEIRPVIIPSSFGHADVPTGTSIIGGETKAFIHTSEIKWDFIDMMSKTEAQDSAEPMAQYMGNAIGLYFTGHILYRDMRGTHRNTVFRRRYDFRQGRFIAMPNPDLDYAD